MKPSRIILLTLLSTTTLLFNRCSTNFDLTSEWKDITIVYGLLNFADSAIYVKVNKAFLDKKTNALVQAQIPDSIYYNNINVTLSEYNSSGVLTNTFNMIRVDGNEEGYIKESGTFPQSPNYLYKVKYSPKTDRTYKVIVNKGDGNTSSASTPIVGDIVVIRPTPAIPTAMLPGNTGGIIASWKAPKNAKFYDLTIRINYIEFPNGQQQDSVQKSFEWKAFDEYIPDLPDAGITIEYKIFTQTMYDLMAQYIPANPNITRKIRPADFIFAAGATDLYTYLQVVKAKEGITQGIIQPDYTNVTNGIGLFTSRSFKSSQAVLKPSTIDSIACNKMTKALRFLNSQDMLCP